MTDYTTAIFAEPVPVAEPPREDGTTRPSKWDATIARLAAHPDQWFIIAETRAASAEVHNVADIAARRGVRLQIAQRVGGPKNDRTTRVYAKAVKFDVADEELEPVVGTLTQQEVTHCHKGHEFTPENTYYRTDGRGRACRTCNAARQNAWRTGAA